MASHPEAEPESQLQPQPQPQSASEPRAPAPKTLGLRFSSLPSNEDVGGKLDGDHYPKETLSTLTRRKGFYPMIMQGIPGTDFESVLTRQQKPPALLRLCTLNCFCHSRFELTRAQWLYLLNLLAFCVHALWAYVTWREGHGKGGDMEIDIVRIKSIWNETEGRGSYTSTLVSNGKPIRIDWLTSSFFALSAAAHLFVVAVGPWDRWIWLYWRQIDRCFGYYRWIEYSLSASTMIMAIGLTVGIRDEATLACLFLLMWSTSMCGLLLELWSRSHRDYTTDRIDGQRWQGDAEPVAPGVQWSRLTDAGKCARMMQVQRRRRNYILRLIPFGVGCVPYIGAQVIVLNAFYAGLNDLRDENEDLLEDMPAWVPYAVFGSSLLFSIFAIPVLVYQWLPPNRWWESEVIFVLLSLTAKVYLGGILYGYVLMSGNAESSLKLRDDVVVNSTVA